MILKRLQQATLLLIWACFLAATQASQNQVYHGKIHTTFPTHWSREKVISSILEAYENSVKLGIQPTWHPNGKYFVQGFCREGVEIGMFITPKGNITTAYPQL